VRKKTKRQRCWLFGPRWLNSFNEVIISKSIPIKIIKKKKKSWILSYQSILFIFIFSLNKNYIDRNIENISTLKKIKNYILISSKKKYPYMFCKYTIIRLLHWLLQKKIAPLIRVYKIEFMTRSTNKLKSKQNVNFVSTNIFRSI